MGSSFGITACLIVRDEQERLERCVRSVADFVDEIVICDTGSRDRTPDIARGLATTFLSVPWDDDFGAARNAALAACTGQWVLSVDADEVVSGRPAWLPVLLDACGDQLDAVSVLIDNVGPAETLDGPRRHRERRLFRPATCTWTGRVHEQLQRADGQLVRAADLPAPTVSLEHDGYGDPEVARAKARRNAMLARRQLAELRDQDAALVEIARAALDLGRSLITCERPDEARASLEFARAQLEPGAADPADPAGRSGASADRLRAELHDWVEHFLGQLPAA